MNEKLELCAWAETPEILYAALIENGFAFMGIGLENEEVLAFHEGVNVTDPFQIPSKVEERMMKVDGKDCPYEHKTFHEGFYFNIILEGEFVDKARELISGSEVKQKEKGKRKDKKMPGGYELPGLRIYTPENIATPQMVWA